MSIKKKQASAEVLVLQYLIKNKDLFVRHPEILEQLEFPSQLKDTNKIIDLNAYRSKKLKSDYDYLKKLMSKILKAGSGHIVSQKRILKSSLKVLNTKSLSKLIDFIVKDLGSLLACDVVNCFFTSNKLKHNSLSQIDNKMVASYFQDKSQINLNQNSKGILVFFPNKSKVITSYILLKINYDDACFVIAMGSKDNNKFTKDQQIDLVEYLIKIIEIKLRNFKY